jgi:hypothetical protein
MRGRLLVDGKVNHGHGHSWAEGRRCNYELYMERTEGYAASQESQSLV